MSLTKQRVWLEFMETADLGVEISYNALPLIIKPRKGNDSVEYLKSWIIENKEWLKGKLLQYGAVLFRGFHVREGLEFQHVVQSYDNNLSNEYRGTSPRQQIPGTEYVFSASELPPHTPIPQHLEMAFLPRPPRNIFFCCLKAPTSTGGETTLCDFKKVYDEIDPRIRKEFEDKGVMYVRNYESRKTKIVLDPTMLKRWEDVFDTTDKAVVETECRSTGLGLEWKRRDGLRIVNKAAAVETHPDSGEKVWFNHSLVFHWSMIYQEYYNVFKRTKWPRYLLLSWFGWALRWIFLFFLGPMKVGFHTSFADGSEIPDKYQHHVRDVVWRNMVFNRWQLGDIVMIDNFRISHGRQPYSGQRRVVVSWSKPTTKSSEVKD